ncbi:hypothetical protein FRACYDRAFT_242207 [Fragilariopsis cylindrus CCMP1102]|uniref:Uncharacterized protein n=1 Tax=Fragilariopsis cylindrus CCMP1102 TaxID=635003 RepID=A0A1E7F6S4_9STRA|nr:hypothetical protein FRACYDRAFT_242207 [Fragilariopsis cylindrus CCMP1102]|eukprot:OEU13856.1 hypothetical protein FRACYDRAFT_242207 [Fragilariopsis cylindrus CCMP1102]
MDSFMEFLLRKHDINSSDVTIVDDKACPELSAALFQLNKPNTASSSPHTTTTGNNASVGANTNANKKCRWSNITDDMNDLRIAKRNLTDLRRSWSILTSTSASTSLVGGMSPPYNRSSFSNDSFNRSNAGWNDNALWDDASSISKTFKTRIDNIQLQEDSDDNDDNDVMIDAEREEVDTRSDDKDVVGETSIDILENFLEDWAVRKDLHSNSETQKLSSSSFSDCEDESSGELTASTYDMEKSYQSFYNKLVSNIHSVANLNHQAPKLPQRKISQDKLRSLSSFLGSNSSLQNVEEEQNDGNSNVSTNSNASFDGTKPTMTAVVSASDQDSETSGKISPFNILPFIKTASQIVAVNTKKKKDASSKEQKQRIIPPYGGDAKSNDSMRIQRLREALGPMAPATKDLDRNNMKSDEGKSVSSIYTAPATNSPSSNSSCSSPSPSVSIDSDSVHSVDTLKASNMPMAMIVDSRCWEDDDLIETLKD